MLERLHEQRRAITLYLLDKRGHENLSDSQWKSVEELVELLRPFEQASRQMCQDDAPLSLQIPVSSMLLAATREKETLSDLRDKLVGQLKERFRID